MYALTINVTSSNFYVTYFQKPRNGRSYRRI